MKVSIKLDNKTIMMASVGAGVLALVIAVVFVCLPAFKALAKAKAEKKAYIEENLSVKTLLATKRNGVNASQMVPKEEVPKVIDALKKICDKYDVGVGFLKASDFPKDTFYKLIRIDMEASATYRSMGLFLSAAREMPEGVVDLNTLYMIVDRNDPNKVTAKITFTLLVAKDNG